MCLGIPAKVESIIEGSFPLMGKVSYGTISMGVCLSFTPDAKQGDFVLIHAGFSIQCISQEAANLILKSIDELEA